MSNKMGRWMDRLLNLLGEIDPVDELSVVPINGLEPG